MVSACQVLINAPETERLCSVDASMQYSLFTFGSCEKGALQGVDFCSTSPKGKAYPTKISFPTTIQRDAIIAVTNGASLLAQGISCSFASSSSTLIFHHTGSTLYAWGPNCKITTHFNRTSFSCFDAPSSPILVEGPWQENGEEITSLAAGYSHVVMAAGRLLARP